MQYTFRCGVALCVLMFLVAGCAQSFNNTWRETKGYYRTYVNTPAELDFSEVEAENVEQELAAMYTPVGEELEMFLREMNGKDVFPNVAWLDSTLKRFPWLTGIVVVNLEGKTLMQRPTVSMKPFNLGPLLDEDKGYVFRELRAYVDETPLGNEAYVAMPFFLNNEMKGLVVAHFDARNLIELSPDANNLIVMTDKKVLWTGKHQFENTPFAEIDWKARLSEQSYAVSEEEAEEYVWFVRYVGNMPLIFGAVSKPTVVSN